MSAYRKAQVRAAIRKGRGTQVKEPPNPKAYEAEVKRKKKK